MRNKIKFLGILLAAGMLVTTGLNTAARGMHQLVPYLPKRVVEFTSSAGGIAGFTVLGKDYVLNDVPEIRISETFRHILDKTKEFFNGLNLERIWENAGRCWENLASISKKVDFSLIFDHR